MRGTWQIACVLSALLWVGCSAPGEPTQPEMEEAPPPPVLAWPDVPCPSRSGFTARQRLDNIIQWSGGSPEADRAQQRAGDCLGHSIDRQLHREKVLQAWVKADQVHRSPGLPLHEKEKIWKACADELTHGSDGS